MKGKRGVFIHFLNIKMQETLEKMIRKDEIKSLSRRKFLKTILKSGLTLGVVSVTPNILLPQTKEKPRYDLSIKEYDSLTKALEDYENVKKDAVYALGNITALQGKQLPEDDLQKILIEPFKENDKLKYRITLNLAIEDISSYTSFFKEVKNVETKNLPSKRPEKQNTLNPNLKQGFYIQVSANKNEKNILNNVEILKKLGYKNSVLQYDKENKIIKVLIGQYGNVSSATDNAKKLLQKDDLLDILENNELGIRKTVYRNEKLDLTWEKIVKEVKILKKKDKQSYDRFKKRVKKRNIENKKAKRKTYTIEEIEFVIRRGVQKYNSSNKKEIDFNLARAIAYCESTYNPYAIGYGIKRGKKVKQGRGLFQLTLRTAKDMGGRTYSEEELFNPMTNTELGLKYISYLMNCRRVRSVKDSDEKLRLLLAAYNGGEPSIGWSDKLNGNGEKQRRYENPENYRYKQTRDYVEKVIIQHNEFKNKPI